MTINKLEQRLEQRLAPEVGKLENLIHHPVYRTPWYLAEVIQDRLYRGAWPSREHLLGLKAMGVAECVNFCSERQQDEMIRSAGMVPYNIPVMDNTAPSLADMDRALEIFDSVTGIIFGHCEQGVGRTGCFMAGIRVRRCGWRPEAALKEAEHFGLSLDVQRTFILELRKG